MPTVDFGTEHELWQRSRKPCIEHWTVPDSMHRQYWV